ncbi:diaminopimelate decarboxylase [Desulfomonile tiedjei]|uniref:Diaminopimelate decarboxylase n=1 Tax=Desulfomonile tiedjei (strain ATCC 49306 / DSM 6799 / DCB-1) TaxID=706587 RepID=I4C849_DESTA|nr:diaminopimelate decarboxylase [Desulfomonile tiedjei]AFM25740.1 diaminopimelate decarboxylase [Desulfomonile tiedjei DSM 6799]
MHHFQYINDELFCENVPVRQICEAVGTPAFIYSRGTLERHFRIFEEPFLPVDHIVCYSMKACSNIAILRVFANLGSGTDIVSGGELFRALAAGVDASRIVYSGVGKKASEIDEALKAEILMFNVESEEELHLVNQRAVALGKRARIALRVNPNVDPLTHPYISTGLKKNKFGIDVERSLELYGRAADMEGIEAIGVDCHIGSQLTELSPFLEAIDRLKEMIGILRSRGISIQYLDIGGGLGIPYDQEEPPAPSLYGTAIVDRIANLNVKLILEPGRLLVGNAGILVTQVLFRKQGPEKSFIIVDAAMNDLIRPSLYNAHHAVWKVARKTNGVNGRIVADLVGPICESSDFLAQSREMEAVETGDLLALMSAGAYGFSMSSNYNSRPRAAEVLVDGDRYFVIRDRESYQDLIRGEHIPPAILQTS